jgi:hypothetical protein
VRWQLQTGRLKRKGRFVSLFQMEQKLIKSL